ncbi:hypothetical protein N7481_001610 [Penicillium waksmanii]|uniref:uncharacterized protein n=1 Tax=Penicillium waksmanii TaxID=69791 RepID=UPI0025492BBB|nr:uncharacterized protein N7481_001610 [Penicillium waksmanii]KAJ6001201.1 hypothetical protein N7481_001610 [Penicillium waksmanii]
MAIPIYYELHDLLNQEAQKKGVFADLDNDIVDAIHHGLIKYQKYYTFMDNTDAYYTALILDPRVKGDILLHQLSDNEAGQMIINAIRENIHEQYRHELVDTQTSSTNAVLLDNHHILYKVLTSTMVYLIDDIFLPLRSKKFDSEVIANRKFNIPLLFLS